MSDLKDELSEITPPKPKRIIRRKAKESAKQVLARTRKKVATAEQALRSAKHHAEHLKQKLQNVNTALNGIEQNGIKSNEIGF